MLTSVSHAFEVPRKDPVLTAVAIGSLAIGIGAVLAVLSFADAVLPRPLPVAHPDSDPKPKPPATSPKACRPPNRYRSQVSLSP